MLAPLVSLVADDYGLREEGDHVIASLAEGGHLDGVSVMTHGGATTGALTRLRDAPVATGLHLTLVGERAADPVGAAALVGRDGRLPPSWRHFVARGPRDLRPALTAEVAAQLRRYDALGLPLDFINAHQHLHLLPWVWPVVRDALAGRPGPPAIRVAPRVSEADGAKERLLTVAAAASFLLRPPSGPRLRAMRLRRSGRMSLRDVARALSRAAIASDTAPIELVFHPGTSAGPVAPRHRRWGYDWDGEARLLRSPQLAALLRRRGFERVRPGTNAHDEALP